jgi:predicted alpha/beta-fold hydrolase
MTKLSPFKPPFYLRNSHIQSVLNSVGPRKFRARLLSKNMQSETLLFTTKKGVTLKCIFDRSCKIGKKKNAVIILIHGWEGSNQSAYMVTTANKLLRYGYDVLRLNLRDHGETQHLNKEIFNSTMTPEVADCIQLFLTERHYPSSFLIGFSLGGNFTLRIAADRGKQLGLSAAIAICPPVDPLHASDQLAKSFFIYQQYFLHRWKNSLRKKIEYFPEYDFSSDLEGAKTINDMNQLFIPKFTGYPDPDSYFNAYALTKDRLQNLQIPAHLIATKDDPIIPWEDLVEIDCPELLKIELYQYGGHCGFIKNIKGESWMETYLLELLAQYN